MTLARVKTLYVRYEDATTWEDATKAATQEGVSMSEYVTTAVRERLDRQAQAPHFEWLSADTLVPVARGVLARQVVRFEGRWIVQAAHSEAQGDNKRDVWSIAITKAGRFVAHVRRANGNPWLGTSDSLDGLEREFLVPSDVIETASHALRQEPHTVWRDI